MLSRITLKAELKEIAQCVTASQARLFKEACCLENLMHRTSTVSKESFKYTNKIIEEEKDNLDLYQSRLIKFIGKRKGTYERNRELIEGIQAIAGQGCQLLKKCEDMTSKLRIEIDGFIDE